MSFKAYEVVVEALKENLGEVSAFVDSHLEEIDCPIKAQMQLDIAVEELFVNIANYAYGDGCGKAWDGSTSYVFNRKCQRAECCGEFGFYV